MTTSDDNPVLQLLITRKQTLTLKLREIAVDLNAWLQDKHPEVCQILHGSTDPGWSQKEAERFTSEILLGKWARTKAVGMLAVFATVVHQANEIYNKTLLPPPVPTIRIRPETPWLPNEVNIHKDAGKLVGICEQLIREVIPLACEGHDILPLLTASALVFGGIANQQSLVALIRAAASTSTTRSDFGNRVELELLVSAGRGLPLEHRIWYSDIISSLLILRFADQLQIEANACIYDAVLNQQKNNQQILSWIWTHLLRDFRVRAKMENIVLKNLSQLIQILTVRYRRKLPPFVVSYMTRAIASTSLNSGRLAHIHGLVAPVTADPLVESNDEYEPGVQTEEAESELDIEADRLRSRLRALFLGDNRKIIRANLLQFAHDCSDMPAKRTAECAAFLLNHKSAWGRQLRISTIKEYTRLIANMLWGILDGADPKEISAGKLAGHYSEILEEVSDRVALRQSLGRALNEFHFFLLTKYKVEPVDFREYGLGISRAGSVDPNLITHIEATRIRDSIKSNASFPEEPRIVRAALVVFLLGQGGGTRRNETRYIRASDIIYEDRKVGRIAEILVRPWGPHEQKSRHAARRLNMTLFEPEEREIVEQWVRERLSTTNVDRNTLLFDWSMEPNGFAFSKIIAVVLSAMRAITGDPSIRFHHLRHTFCTKLLVELTLLSEHVVPLQDSQWPSQLLGADPYQKSARARYQLLCGTSGATRKVLFAIAQALGHAGTDTSCTYYLHALDGLTAILLEHADLTPSKRTIASASGLSESSAYELMAKHGNWHLVTRLLPPEKHADTVATPEIKSSSDSWIENLWNFLSLAGSPIIPVPLEELALEYEFDPIHALRMVDRAKKISAMRSNSGTYKFLMVEQKSTGERLWCPKRVHLLANRELVLTLASSAAKLLSSELNNLTAPLDTWIQLVPHDSNRLTLKSYADSQYATQFRDFLELLGIEYRWISYDMKPNSISRREWIKRLNVKRSRLIDIEKPPNGSGQDAKNWIAIEPLLTLAQNINEKPAHTGAEAFRFFMVMSAIYVA